MGTVLLTSPTVAKKEPTTSHQIGDIEYQIYEIRDVHPECVETSYQSILKRQPS